MLNVSYPVDFHTIGVALLYSACLYPDMRQQVKQQIIENDNFRVLLDKFDELMGDRSELEIFMGKWTSIFEKMLAERGG
ncbi:hypothetical protein AKO1_012408 [Acrasis kona]|uniref:Protein kinase domain-containing protein n=1 Tax=Acrasis kona TaxID=1008807 RepID=A0AAW2YXD6_9EUKA